MLPAVPTNRFVGAVRIISCPYISIYRGSCSTSHPYKYLFVGAIQSRTAPTVRFPEKKIKFTIQIRPEHCLFPRIPSSVRVAERPATSVPNRVRVAERPATSISNPLIQTTSTRVLYKLQLQVQFTRIYTIHH